jgi:hypothetical protein
MNIYFLSLQCLGLLILLIFFVSGHLPAHWSTQDKKKFLNEVKNFYWDDPYLFKYCPDQIFQRCIPNNEVSNVIKFCHSKAYGGHFSSRKTTAKSYKVDFTGPPCSRTHMHSTRLVKIVKSWDLFQNVT